MCIRDSKKSIKKLSQLLNNRIPPSFNQQHFRMNPLMFRTERHLRKRNSKQMKNGFLNKFKKDSYSKYKKSKSIIHENKIEICDEFITLPLISLYPICETNSTLLRSFSKSKNKCNMFNNRIVSIGHDDYFICKDLLLKAYFNNRKLELQLEIDNLIFQKKYLKTVTIIWKKKFCFFNLLDPVSYTHLTLPTTPYV